MAHASKRRNRVYERRFDHDEARRLRFEEELSYAEIARRVGVSPASVRRACDLEFRRRADARAVAHAMTGVCEQCGGPRARYRTNARDGRKLCRRCGSTGKQTRFTLDAEGEVVAIRCGSCTEWKPPREFGRYKRGSRGYRLRCRTCDSATRRDYRERIKVPCVGCGTPALPANEKVTHGADFPRCRSCMYEWQRTPEGREVMRQAQLRAWDGRARNSSSVKAKPNLCPKGHVRRRGAKVCDTCIAEAKARQQL